MKHIYKSLLAAVAALPVLASCVEEKIEKGAPENDSYGVYFETLSAARKSVEFDPAEKAELTFKAFRTSENDEITVPIVMSATAAGVDASEIFTASEITFKEGATETEFTVSFPKAELGTTYTCSVSCEDENYVKVYSQNPTSFSFSVTRVKWNLVVGPNKEEYGSWKDDILSSAFSLSAKYCVNDKIQIYEREDKKGYYRIQDVYNPYMLAKFWNNQYPDSEFEENCTPGTYSYIDATNPDKVWLPVQTTGATIGSDGYIEFASFCSENGFSGNSMYGTMEKGVIKFPVQGVGINFTVTGGWYYGNSSGNLVIVLPGCKDNDYSLAVQTGLSEDGKVPFLITMGADLAKANYKFYSGKIADADIYFKALEVARDAKADFVTQTSTLSTTLEATGVYTLVVAGLDAKGDMQIYKSVEFSYVAADDEVPVVLECGIGSAAKYAPSGYSTDNTVEAWMYGKDLTAVKFAAVKAADLKVNPDACFAALLKTAPVSAEVLEKINTTGYATPVSKLLPGTEYAILVYATNGYEEELFMSEETIFTTGDPLPIYQQFIYSDYIDELEPKSENEFIGTWNLYATDLFGKLGMREYVGKAVISDSELADEGPDDNGLYDEYLTVKGLAGPYAAKAGFDDAMTFDLYGGCLYNASETTNDGKTTTYVLQSDGKAFNGAYLQYFIPVMDGYYAFVCISKYQSTYDFRGIGFLIDGGFAAGYIDYLLVDPAKDDNGLAPKASAKASKAACRIADEIVSGIKVPYRPVEYELLGNANLGRERASKNEPSVRLYMPDFAVEGVPAVKAASAKVESYSGDAFKVSASKELKIREDLRIAK